MRIAQVAAACGCTVRALRHYHQVGALPEPRRRSNNYRDYSSQDLINAMTITALTSAGIPLAEVNTKSTTQLIERASALLDQKQNEIDLQREKLERIRDGKIEAPSHIKQRLREIVGDCDFLHFELEALDLMALAGVATSTTWARIHSNLSDETLITNTKQLAALWNSLASLDRKDAEIVLRSHQIEAVYTEGIGPTLLEGHAPISLEDFNISPGQHALLNHTLQHLLEAGHPK